MKKLALILFLFVSIAAAAPVMATTCLDTGCSPDQICKGDPPTCQANNAGNCSPSCTNGQVCPGGANGSGGTCQTPGGAGTQTGGGSGSGQAFVPLTDIPAFGSAGAPPSLPVFLNTLYLYCIGIAVVIAVLQLARAGITYMLADSITTKEEARHLIGASVFGLLLVLSPYIVFKLINPAILTLNISTDGLKLAPMNGTDTLGAGTNNDGTNGAENGDNGHQYLRCNQTSCDAQVNTCQAGGGTASYVCREQTTGKYTPVDPPYTCAQGSYNYIDCYKGTAGQEWYYDGGKNYFMCTETVDFSGEVWGECTTADKKCTDTGGKVDHVCRNRQTGTLTPAPYLNGKYGCDQGNDPYTQCTP